MHPECTDTIQLGLVDRSCVVRLRDTLGITARKRLKHLFNTKTWNQLLSCILRIVDCHLMELFATLEKLTLLQFPCAINKQDVHP